MDRKRFPQILKSDMALLLYIAGAAVACHLLTSGNYGYFIDELYTLACSRHPSLAFVDIPPAAPLLLALNTALFGDSLYSLHILPSLFCGAMAVLVGLMARELGGGRKAMLFAGLCAALVPTWMVVGTLFTYDFLDQFMVALLFYAFILLLKRENPKIWLVIGLIAGAGVMVKPSMLFFAAGIAAALLFARQRRQYLTRWPWLGAAIAVAVILPALAWQALNGFPLADYWAGYTKWQTMKNGPAAFLLMQVFGMNVLLLPVWALGLGWFLFRGDGGRFRLLGVIFCVLLVLFMLMDVKMYMPIPLYAMLLAGGAVAIEKFVGAGKRRKILLPAFAAVLVLAGLMQAPLLMPILPEDTILGYSQTIGGVFGFSNVQVTGDTDAGMPMYFYSRFDWDLLAEDVAKVYYSLPEEERAGVTIASQNYAYAGAVDLFGEKLGLPAAACGRLNYYYFSRDNMKSGTWIAFGVPEYFLYGNFREVTLAARSISDRRSPWAISIYICRGMKPTAEEMKKEFRSVK